MINQRVYGYPVGLEDETVDLGEWALVGLAPVGNGIEQDPPDITGFTIRAVRNGIWVMFKLNGALNNWEISFEDGTPTVQRLTP